MREHTAGRRRAFAGLVALLTGVALLVAPTTASAGELQINQLVQQQDQWCWVASGLTIAKFHNKGNVSQNDFCALGRGYPKGTPCPNQAGYLQYDQRAFRALGLSQGQVGSPPSFQKVASEIDAGRPIETGIYWTAGGGHAQVIYGYQGQTLSYGDPWPASPRYSEMSYDDYLNNYEFQWGEALYGAGA